MVSLVFPWFWLVLPWFCLRLLGFCLVFAWFSLRFGSLVSPGDQAGAPPGPRTPEKGGGLPGVRPRPAASHGGRAPPDGLPGGRFVSARVSPRAPVLARRPSRPQTRPTQEGGLSRAPVRARRLSMAGGPCRTAGGAGGALLPGRRPLRPFFPNGNGGPGSTRFANPSEIAIWGFRGHV